MLRRWLLSALAVSLAPVALSFSSVAGSAPITTGRYIVVLKDSASAPALADSASGLGATVDSLFATVNTLVLSLPVLDVKALQRDPRVAYVTADRPVSASKVAQDPTVPTGVERIGAAPATTPDGASTPAKRSGKKAAVALLDTGVMDRSDLNVVGGYDCAPSGGLFGGGGLLGSSSVKKPRGSASGAADGADAAPADNNGHGTHVAGIVGDKGIPGVIGVSPGTPLYAVRVFGANGSGNISNVICGLNWVAQNAAALDIRVVNMSLGGEGTDDGNCGQTDQDPFHTAVCRVTAAGVTVVAAAGNEGQDLAKSTPAAYDEVLAVTAMADYDGEPGGLATEPTCSGGQNVNDDSVAPFSDYASPGSSDIDHTIAAPGMCITSTWNDGGTETISGTSMASPHVAGLVARCIDAGPCAGMTPAQIITKLRADAASRPLADGFFGDPGHPIPGKYYGPLADDLGY